MNIKTTLAILLAVGSPLAFSAQRVDNYNDALSQAGDEGVIVYLYGPDWNRKSTNMLKTFWKGKDVEQAAGESTMVAIPLYQRPNDAQKAEQERIQGDFRIPPPKQYRSIPAIFMLDNTGRVYAWICGTDGFGEGETGALAVKQIKKYKELFAKQRELMEKSDKADGLEKARLIGQASTLGIEPTSQALDQIKTFDPNDETGFVRRLTFDPHKFQEDHKDDETFAIEAEVMKIVEDKAYSELQRQEAYCVLIGQLRREKATPDVLKRHILAMQKIDEKSMYGQIVPHLLEMWCGEKPAALPTSSTPTTTTGNNKKPKKR